MNILGKGIVLRAIEATDIDALHHWNNDPEIQNNLGGWHFPTSRASVEKWVGSFRIDSTDQRFIIEAEGHGAVGMANLVQINWKDRNGFHGMLIGDRNLHGRGIGASVVSAIMRYAFEELGLERIDTTIVEYNAASLKLYLQKCGWVEEGRKARAIYRQGRFWTNVLLGVTRAQYDALKAQGRLAP